MHNIGMISTSFNNEVKLRQKVLPYGVISMVSGSRVGYSTSNF